MSTSLVRATRLILVAHAATAATREAAFPAPADEPGPADLAAAARLVLPLATAEVLASPALAAKRTAEALGRAYRSEPALRDLDAGRWAGSALATIIPAELAAWIGDPGFDGHGGESLATMTSRVRSFLDAKRETPGLTVAITHGAVLRAAVLATLDAPASAFWRIEAPPLATLTLSSDGRRWTLRGLEVRPVTASGV